MHNDPTNDRTLVEQGLQSVNLHPDDIERLASFGAAPETDGQELVAAVVAGRYSAWLTADIVDAEYVTTDLHEPAAIALEARVASTIGTSGSSSIYTRLFSGGTTADAPLEIEVIHINCNPEDMRFPALGPRILIDGRTIPIRDGLFDCAEGYHIPFDLSLSPELFRELFRTIRPGGHLLYAPSSNTAEVKR